MTKEQLQQVLFSKRTRVYAVLDGASVPGLRMQLYKFDPPHFCLQRGKLEPDMAEVMPYVVILSPNSPFTDWILSESYGKHWGIFAHSRFSIHEMRRHFRALFRVHNERGEPLIFRFYDPRVLPDFLQTCNGGELKTFFGKVETFFSEDKKGEGFFAYSLDDEQLKETKLN